MVKIPRAIRRLGTAKKNKKKERGTIVVYVMATAFVISATGYLFSRTPVRVVTL